MGTEEPQKHYKDKRGESPRHVQGCEEEKTKDKIGPERIALESSTAGAGLEAPGQPRLSYREMQ